MTKVKTYLTIALFAMVMSSVAYADPVAGLFNQSPTATLLSDNSAEFFFDVDASETVTVGDIFVAIVGINTIGGTTIGSGTVYNELTAIQAAKIDYAADINFGPPGPDDSFGEQAIDLWEYTAVPLTAADTAYFNWADFGLENDGTMFALLFEDASQDYTRNSTIADGIDSAINGTLRLIVGLVPDNGDFLSVIAPYDVADFGTVPAATAIDNTNIALDGTILAQFWYPLIFNDNITGGNGGFSSPEDDSEFPIFDNLDFTVTATAVPEPSTLALLGIGLLGGAFYGRMLRRK